MGLFGFFNRYDYGVSERAKHKERADAEFNNSILTEIVSAYALSYTKFEKSEIVKKTLRVMLLQNDIEKYTVSREGVVFLLKNGEKRQYVFKDHGLPNLDSMKKFPPRVMSFSSSGFTSNDTGRGSYSDEHQARVHNVVSVQRHSGGIRFVGSTPYIDECYIVGYLTAQFAGLSYKYYEYNGTFVKQFEPTKTW